MKDNYCFIDDVLEKKFASKLKKNEEKAKEEQNQDNENNNIIKKDENELGENLIKVGDEKDNYNFNLDADKNPFTKVLIGGGVAAGAGIGVAGGSIAACIAFDSVFLASTAGEIFAAGFSFLGGIAFTGIGLLIAVPSLLGFGIYKIYKTVKDKKRKNFFENFDKDIMKLERQFQSEVISKIDHYFNKRITLEPEQEKDVNDNINSIIDTYIKIENKRLQPRIDSKEKDLIKKMKKNGEIIAKNISKIRQELMMKILSSTNKKIIDTFEEGIPLFKEFIKNFGPLYIDEDDEKYIDMKIDNIITIMKKILEKKMDVSFSKFDLKIFTKSFDIRLEALYEEKLKLDSNIKKSDFNYNCINFIIEPIGENSKNYGILSLFFRFTLIIQNIAAKKNQQNYNMNKQKIIFSLNNYPNQALNMSQMQMIQMSGLQNNAIYQMYPMYPMNQLYQYNNGNSQIFQMPNNFNLMNNGNLVQNNNNKKEILITFIIKEKEKDLSKINIQAFDDITIEILIKKFKDKMFDYNFDKSKFLVDDKTPIEMTSKENVNEKGIKNNSEIYVYYEK